MAYKRKKAVIGIKTEGSGHWEGIGRKGNRGNDRERGIGKITVESGMGKITVESGNG